MTALNAQSTQLAQQLADIAKATQIAVEVQSTVNAQQAAYMTVVAQATEVPPIEEIADLPVEQPTDLPAPTAMPLPTETQIPTLEPPTPTPDIEEWMETSNILLFEDIAGTLLVRYIKAALDGMGLPYVDVKDAVGDFKGQLLSGTDWDLIISGVEARSGVQGEFFGYLNDQVNRGSAVILEVWNLDDIGGAKATTLLQIAELNSRKIGGIPRMVRGRSGGWSLSTRYSMSRTTAFYYHITASNGLGMQAIS